MLCYIISFNCFPEDEGKKENVWVYQSVIGFGSNYIFWSSGDSVNLSLADVTIEEIDCDNDNVTLCLGTLQFDILMPKKLTDTWESGCGNFRIQEEKLNINLLGLNIADYFVIESKKHTISVNIKLMKMKQIATLYISIRMNMDCLGSVGGPRAICTISIFPIRNVI